MFHVKQFSPVYLVKPNKVIIFAASNNKVKNAIWMQTE